MPSLEYTGTDDKRHTIYPTKVVDTGDGYLRAEGGEAGSGMYFSKKCDPRVSGGKVEDAKSSEPKNK